MPVWASQFVHDIMELISWDDNMVVYVKATESEKSFCIWVRSPAQQASVPKQSIDFPWIHMVFILRSQLPILDHISACDYVEPSFL